VSQRVNGFRKAVRSSSILEKTEDPEVETAQSVVLPSADGGIEEIRGN